MSSEDRHREAARRLREQGDDVGARIAEELAEEARQQTALTRQLEHEHARRELERAGEEPAPLGEITGDVRALRRWERGWPFDVTRAEPLELEELELARNAAARLADDARAAREILDPHRVAAENRLREITKELERRRPTPSAIAADPAERRRRPACVLELTFEELFYVRRTVELELERIRKKDTSARHSRGRYARDRARAREQLETALAMLTAARELARQDWLNRSGIGAALVDPHGLHSVRAGLHPQDEQR